MLDTQLTKAIAIGLFCGTMAFSATWLRQRQLSPAERANRPTMLTPLGAGLTALIGAVLGIALFQGWSA